MRILLMRDASNFHRALAGGLRALGHEAVVASDGSRWMDTERDIDLRRPFKNKLGGLLLWLKVKQRLSELRSFDVVSIATQSFISLRPGRTRWLYDYLLRENGSMFYSALGTDSNYVRACLDPAGPLRYNEYRIFDRPSPYHLAHPEDAAGWLSPELTELGEHIMATVEGATTGLYEYHLTMRRALPAEKIAYCGIPIDTASIEPLELPERIDCVNLFLGRHRDRQLEKGTDVIEAAAREVVARHPGKARLTIVENLPYAHYLEAQRQAHVVLDQLYSYTPATNALLAMARGLCTLSGGAPEFYDFIGEKELRPVIHVEPTYDSVVEQLERIVAHPEGLCERGRQGRAFVEKHNDARVVAQRHLDFWTRRLREEGKL